MLTVRTSSELNFELKKCRMIQKTIKFEKNIEFFLLDS
jgi:hypothetical protein